MLARVYLTFILLKLLSREQCLSAQEICGPEPGDTSLVVKAIAVTQDKRSKIIVPDFYADSATIESEFKYVEQKFQNAVKTFQNNKAAVSCLGYIKSAYNSSLDIGINQVLKCCGRNLSPDFVDQVLVEVKDELSAYLNSSEKCPSVLQDLIYKADTLVEAADYFLTYSGSCLVDARKYIQRSIEESKTSFESCILQNTKISYKINLTKPK